MAKMTTTATSQLLQHRQESRQQLLEPLVTNMATPEQGLIE